MPHSKVMSLAAAGMSALSAAVTLPSMPLRKPAANALKSAMSKSTLERSGSSSFAVEQPARTPSPKS